MDQFFESGWLALKRFAEFRGRSTRTELVSFWVVTVGIAAVFALPVRLVDLKAGRVVETILFALFLCPLVALLVRRLHDQGRGGWWLLLGAPAFALGLVERWYLLNDDIERLLAPRPPALSLVAAASGLAVVAFALWPNQEEANRYGPNPRYDEPGVAA